MFLCVPRAVLPSAVAIHLVATLLSAIPGFAASWVPVPNGTIYPPARSAACAAYDSRRGRILLINGAYHGFSHSPYVVRFSDTWSLDPANSLWSFVTSADSGVTGASEWAAAAYDSLNDRIILSGGATRDAYGDFVVLETKTWSLDAGNPSAWHVIAPSDPTGVGRIGHSLVVDPMRRRLIRFGGTEGNVGPVYDDVWALSLDGPAGWTQIQPVGSPPPARWHHGAVYDPLGNRMIVRGGLSGTGSELADTWQLSLSGTPQWSAIDAPAGPVGPCRLEYDAERDRIIAIGNVPNTLGAWELARSEPAQWRMIDVAPGSMVPARYTSDYATAFDPATRTIAVLFSSWGSAVGIGLNPLAPPVTVALDLSPLPAVQMTATLDSVVHHDGSTRLVWTVGSSRPLYGPVRVSRRDRSSDVFVGERLPNGSGRISVTETTLQPDSTYDYVLAWYDGEHYESLPDFPVATPPVPITLDLQVDSLLARGGDVWVMWSTADDSASFLSPLTLWRRIDDGVWAALTSGFPVDGAVRFQDRMVQSERRYTYRLGWGAGGSQHVSAETTIATPVAATFRRAYAQPGLSIVEWRYPRSLPQNPSVFVHTDRFERITDAHPDSFDLVRYTTQQSVLGIGQAYWIAWEEGGATRMVPSVPEIALPPPAYITSVKPLGNGLELRYGPPPADTLTDLAIDRSVDGAAWREIARLPVPAVEGSYVDPAVAGDQLDYRVRWTFGGIELTSGTTTYVVPVGDRPAPFALAGPSPLPADAQVTLRCSLPNSGSARVDLFDVTGRRVVTQTLSGPGTKQVILDTSRIKPGIYVVQLTQDTHVMRSRAVIVH